jgi:flagellar hook-associated protein 3 FlgL
MSDNEDIDIEKVIMELKSHETVHRAALSAGARIIQPTLLDFLR